MIAFDQVSKQYSPDHYALRDVSFTIQPGELVFLAGPSGAGKSSLLKLLAGVERASSGRVLLAGQDLGKLKRSSLPYLRRKLGLILQEHGLLSDRSILANVMFPLLICGTSQAEAKSRAALALEKVGLAERLDALPASLSGGEQQRAAIARAIVNRPQIILADEPTAYLDRDNASRVIAMLKAFQSAGVTCIISSHDEQILDQASRVIYLSKGQITPAWQADFTPDTGVTA